MKDLKRSALALLLVLALMLPMTGCSTALVLLGDGLSVTPTPAPTAEPTPLPAVTAAPEPTAAPTTAPIPTAEPDEPEVPATPLPEQVEITEDNYQLLFAPAPGYDYIGIAYMKVPEGYGRFADAYLPYGGTLEYLEGGYAVRGTAHGMAVYETILQVGEGDTAEDAMELLIDRYKKQAAFYGVTEWELSDGDYYPEYDVVVLTGLATNADSGETYATVLYTETRGGGYYFGAMITYIPSQFDEKQPELLLELSDVFALVLPDY